MDNTLPHLQGLPWAIANSIIRIYEDKFFSHLICSAKKVLSTLIRSGLNIENPNQFIFIKKSTIAKLLGINEATVYRALSKLEEEKLIEREPQNKTSKNLKVIGKIKITSIALKAIGIENYLKQTKIKKKKNIENKEISHNQEHPLSSNDISNASDDHVEATQASPHANQTDNRLAQMQDKNNKSSIQSLQRQSEQRFFKKIQGKSIPQDLAWLVEENELEMSGLFKLMKMAREQGKRLSDIVAVCAHSLRKVKGRPLYGYLQKLINKEYDFEYVRVMQEQEKAERQQETEAKAEAKRQIELAKTTLRGKKFRLNLDKFIEFTEDGIVFFDMKEGVKRFSSYEQSTSLIKAAIQGSIESVDNVPLPSIAPNQSKNIIHRSAKAALEMTKQILGQRPKK